MDAHLMKLAESSPNFGRLVMHSELLAVYGAQAEAHVFTDANGALVHTRQFGEVLAELLAGKAGLQLNAGISQVARLDRLRKAGLLTGRVEDAFTVLRKAGNDAAHNHLFDRERALNSLRAAFALGAWYYRVLTADTAVIEFVPPVENQALEGAEHEALRKALADHKQALTEAHLRLTEQKDVALAWERAQVEAESEIAKARVAQEELRSRNDALNAELARLKADHERAVAAAAQQTPATVSAAARDELIRRAQRPAPLNEVESRRVIDQMLTDAGWLIQDLRMLNPLAAKGVVVREFPLATGRADYVLFVEGSIVGVIEAKRAGDTLAAAQAQNARYAAGVTADHQSALWHPDNPFPFRYASSGAETTFSNQLDPVPSSRPVFSFHRPETIERWMDQAKENPGAPTYRARLRTLPTLDKRRLRLPQSEAITGLEDSLAKDRARALIQMATGAGKTFTAVTETYRLLKHAKAARVLFLVDRNNLGRQALKEFQTYTTPDDGRKFTELYNAERLSGRGINASSAVVISTIQKMYALLQGETVVINDAADDQQDTDDGRYDVRTPKEVAYNASVPPESFDLIIIDECHRSIYGLWRGVLEYFDAPLVGLTATPTKQTVGFFGRNIVSEYPYSLAVADGVNVDFQMVRLSTKIGEEGSVIDEGTTVVRRDRRTRAQRLEQLDDDFVYAPTQLGRSVIANDHIRTVLTVWRDNWRTWFPGRVAVPKTLIFATDDNHAEDIVRITKEVFPEAGDQFVQKITYKVRQANLDPEDLINELRNGVGLRIAVTVDMIATGTDVRALECLIFLRQVRSAVLFEQMKGRGARTLDPVELAQVTPEADSHTRKDQFLLIDAVGVTDSPLVEADPLSAPVIGDSEKRLSMQKLMDKTGVGAITADEARELAGRLARLDRRISDEDRDELAALGGTTLASLARGIVESTDPDTSEALGPARARDKLDAAIAKLTANPEYRERIMTIRREYDITYDETTQDEIRRITISSPAEQAAARILAWHGFLTEHDDKIAAIDIIVGKRGADRAIAWPTLKEIAGKIRHAPYSFTPAVLWNAYRDLGKTIDHQADIPDLVPLARYELGLDPDLRPYRAAVDNRFTAWRRTCEQAGVTFTDDQIWWLERIRDTVARGVGVSVQDIRDDVTFAERGGAVGLVRAFGGREKARALIAQLDRELA
ncbi:DEAD/DEAH box helicase family protein [Nocardia sp. CA-129566]|uniref:type I restriction endonuclease subunit R n=1 Tax=Nocardia sp. CA-129566 TaxID=3239976 RepID=UPI003D97992B